MSDYKKVLDFWFEGLNDKSLLVTKDKRLTKWFKKDEKFDEEIRQKFELYYDKARNRELDEWEESLEGRMALIILFDQFSRNMFRGTPKMFESDPISLELAVYMIKDNEDKELSLIQRTFLYLPLEHAENLAMQDFCIMKYEELVKDSEKISPHNTKYFNYNLEYAHKHHAVIQKFGRFPHRNKILNRESTPEEIEFLKKPGSSF